jgi:hypothetical protein
MTPLAPDEGRLVCRVQLTAEGRWVSIALSLDDLSPVNRFLTISERFSYELAGLDEPAREYTLSNWQGGVISGARYAFRALKAPPRQVRLHELRGQLGSGDVSAVSSAAAVAVARLLDRPAEFPLDLANWNVEVEVWPPRPSPAGGPSGPAQTVPAGGDPAQGLVASPPKLP